MGWTEKSVAQRIARGEDNRTEFKEAQFSGAKLKGDLRSIIAKELCAFGNTDGGVLIISVSDDNNEVVGMTAKQLDALQNAISEIGNDSLAPPLHVKMEPVELLGNKFVLVTEVAESDFRPHSTGGKHYERDHDKTRVMRPHILQRLFRESGRRFQQDEQTVDGTGPGTFSPALAERFLGSSTNESANSQLSKLGLLGEDRTHELRATVAGILLCTEKPHEYLPNALIHAVRYRGTGLDGRQVDAKNIIGPLDRQIKEAVTFAVRNMSVSARKDPARTDMPQYSERAIFEAVVNAVIHRDYSIRGSKIRMFLFDDRLELYSPGGLNNSLTVENMPLRQSTRNETIVSALDKVPLDPDIPGTKDSKSFMELRGQGIRIICKETKGLTGRLPVFELLDDAELRLILPAAPLYAGSVQAEVSVCAGGRPIEGAHVLAIYPNTTCKFAKTDSLGRAIFDFHSRLPMTVFCAADKHHAFVEKEWVPAAPLAVDLNPLPNGGSAIISPHSEARLPGFAGGLEPIQDELDRLYIYALNIAIDQGKPQPVQFKLGKNLHMEDSDGNKRVVRIIHIVQRLALLEYEAPA
ncbi:MAG: putative DNA binding domain-containing protein [Gammaproteobacteria bacterium]|nr:putative DNA binding domain-containing protein [Gammaproteobacteria bacterium]